jgi:hypothetical protein
VSGFSLAFVDDPESRHPEFPWASLRPVEHAGALMDQARRFWSENAFNEYASALQMMQLAQALGEAQVPTALWARACTFATDELVHVELCAGVARRCGGTVDLLQAPQLPPLDPALTPLERANQLVLRVCCLGEAVSQPLLAGNLRAARQPLARAVLERIVRDETRHARFGWDYFDWSGPRLTDVERQALGELLGAALRHWDAAWRGDVSVGDGGGLGWMSPAEWQSLAKETIAETLVANLRRYGIEPR